MRNEICFYLAFVIVLSALCSACATAPVSAPPETPQSSQFNELRYQFNELRNQFKELRYNFTIPLYPERQADSPALNLTLNLVGITSPAEQAQFFHKTLYSGESLEAYRDRVVKEQSEIYRSMPTSANIQVGEDLSSLNWHYTEEVTVKGAGNDGIMVERVVDTYSGGAHGLAVKKYYALDLDSLRQVTISDLFEDYHDARIKAIIYDALRNYGNLAQGQPLSEGGFFPDAPELTENFYVTEQGLGLCWNRYEIAPYAMGSIDIVIPWRDIRPRMLHSGMELLTKFRIYLFM